MPHAIISGMLAEARIALIHVNVADAPIRLELESLVGLALGTPGLAEGEDLSIRIAQSPLDLCVDQVVEVVAVARPVGRQQTHVLRVEHMAADIVEPAIP